MQRILLTFFLLLFEAASYAQTPILVSTSEEQIGNSVFQNQSISGLRHLFSERIYNASINSTTGCMTIQFRRMNKSETTWKNDGFVVYYDVRQKAVKWSKKVDYRNVQYKQYNDQLFEITAQKSHHINVETGERDIEIYGRVFMVNKAGIGIAMGSNATLQGIDSHAKKMIWQVPIDNSFGWNNLKWLNDSVLLITADGLYGLNVLTGKKWSYLAVTGDKDYSRAIGMGVAGVALGVLTGTMIVPTGPDVISSIASPPVVDSGVIYFASKENIVGLDQSNGKVIWTKPLPKELTSNSTLFVKDHFLYMVNHGYAYKGGSEVRYGAPFIAKYDLETGDEVFVKTISQSKMVRDFDVRGEELVLVFDERIVNYSMSDGGRITSADFDKLKYGSLKNCIGEHVYRRCNDSAYRRITLSDSSKTYVYGSMRKVMEIDHELSVSDQWGADQLGTYDVAWNDYTLIKIKGETIVLDKEGKKVATLNINGAAVWGNKLYDIQEKSLVEINLNEMVISD